MGKPSTTAQFIEKSNTVHSHIFDYSLVEYQRSNMPVMIICNVHGKFPQTPNKHLGGQGCPYCSGEKTRQTNLKKYGTENPFGNMEIKEKIKKTNLKKYGTENPSQNEKIKYKKRQTCLNNYGVENPFYIKEVQENIKRLNIERYGCESPLGNKEVQVKIKKTNLERYGVSCTLQNKDVRNKVTKTNLKKYGCESPFGNKEVQEKTKKTNLERYGVEYSQQKHMSEILLLIENKEWLFEQHITLNKTILQISKELNISDVSVGNYLHKHEIEIRYTAGYSMKCIRWLESIIKQNNIFIQHAKNLGEYRIPGTRFSVDGYCHETNTVYEFHGDIFHGNPELFEDHETPNFYNREATAKELYINTIERENKIKELGYNLVIMWENDFNKLEEKICQDV